MKTTVFIPCHDRLDFRCDYVVQTAKALVEKGYLVRLVAFKHPHHAAILWKRDPSYPPVVRRLLRNTSFQIMVPNHILPCVRPFRRLWRFEHQKFLKTLIKEITSVDRAIVWYFRPEDAELVSQINQNKHVNMIMLYDCVDYFSSPNIKIEEHIRKREKNLIENVDYFFVNSHILKSVKQRIRKDINVVPQGFDRKAFATNSRKLKRDSYKLFTAIPKPRVGFIGHITHRLDFSLLIEICELLPLVSFVFTQLPLVISNDPLYADVGSMITTLRSHKNVFFIPHYDDRRTAKYIIDQFNIGMVPYNTSFALNRYSFPTKIFEYFYMGKPVLATPIEELKRFPKYVKIGSTVKEWERHINVLLSRPWPKEYQRRERRLAEENSWERKVEAVSRIIENPAMEIVL